MTPAVLRALVISAALACGACASHQAAPAASEAAVAPAPTTPSPRPECASAHVTIYFAEEVAGEPAAMPLLNELMTLVHNCEHAGGELRGITIATTADPGQSARDAEDQLHRRQDRVRNALIALGAPADKIHNGRAEGEALMNRRADVSADLY